MEERWTTLKEIVIDPKGGASIKTKEYSEFGTPVLTKGDVKPFGRVSHGGKYVNTEFALNKNWRFTKEGDFIVTTRDLSVEANFLGLVSKVPIDQVYVVNQGATLFTIDGSIVDSDYLIYWCCSSYYRNHIQSNFVGSTQIHIRNADLLSAPIMLKDMQEQRAIASLLSALDDKIELNLQMNKTMEEMALALYKHWFVDFGPFQNVEFVDSELGMIPKGWEVKTLVEFVKLTMGQSPKSEFYNDNKEGLPFHQGVSNYGVRFPNDITYSTSGNRQAQEGDILFSVRAPVGRLNIAKNRIILGRGLAGMHMKGNNSFLFYALKTKFTSDDMIGSGTIYKSVNKKDLENLKFVIPSVDVLERFNVLVQPNDEAYFVNSRENETLTNLRDTMLPKLISGEVRVKDIEQTIAKML